MKYQQVKKYYSKQPFFVRLYIFLRLQILDFDKIFQNFPTNIKRVQEIGCGYGITSFLLADLFNKTQIQSYDIDKDRIEKLKSNTSFHNLKFSHKNVLDIDKFNSDLIFMGDLLHHLNFNEQKQLLIKIAHTAPKNSIIIVKDMDKGHFSFRQLLNYIIDIAHTKNLFFYYHSKSSFINLFQSCGLEIKKQGYVNRWYIPLNHIFFVLKMKNYEI